MFGTGTQGHAQAGYLMNKDLFGEGSWYPDAVCDFANAKLDRLDKQMNV